MKYIKYRWVLITHIHTHSCVCVGMRILYSRTVLMMHIYQHFNNSHFHNVYIKYFLPFMGTKITSERYYLYFTKDSSVLVTTTRNMQMLLEDSMAFSPSPLFPLRLTASSISTTMMSQQRLCNKSIESFFPTAIHVLSCL